MEYYICAPNGKALSGEGKKSLERILALAGVEIIQRELFSAVIRYAGSDFEIRRLTEPKDIAILPKSAHDDMLKLKQAEFFSGKDDEKYGFHLHGEF